jgi:hypothetical protein
MYHFTWALFSNVDFGIRAGGNIKFLAASLSTSTKFKVPNTLLHWGRYSNWRIERDRIHGPCRLKSMKKSCNKQNKIVCICFELQNLDSSRKLISNNWYLFNVRTMHCLIWYNRPTLCTDYHSFIFYSNSYMFRHLYAIFSERPLSLWVTWKAEMVVL